jgi:FRG domain
MENTFTVICFDTWAEYKNFVDGLSENWAFRGQGDAIWALQNAIERTDFIHFRNGIEAEFLAEFQRGARNYLTKDQIPEHIIEWLALMQHHGAPTRLLDFTKSPFIASYFAFEHCIPNPDYKVAVWAININYLRKKSVEVLSQQFAEELELTNNLINEEVFEKIFYSNKLNLVFPVEPFRMNRRYSLQQSIFVSTGTSEAPFMSQLSFLEEAMSQAVIKIEMPAVLQKEVLRNLQRMNLNRASLFPDLDGYAASLKLRYNSLKTPEEVMKQQLKMLEDEDFKLMP